MSTRMSSVLSIARDREDVRGSVSIRHVDYFRFQYGALACHRKFLEQPRTNTY